MKTTLALTVAVLAKLTIGAPSSPGYMSVEDYKEGELQKRSNDWRFSLCRFAYANCVCYQC
jgi:hypothetical protein